MKKHSFTRFVRLLGGLVLGYLLVALALTTIVDPWRANGFPWQSAAVDSYREISDVVRIGKAALARRGDWQVAILGSSRMEIGVDPSHPLFAGKKTVNLSMSAANLLENIPAARYALRQNPHLETLILGIDPGDLTSDLDIRSDTGFYDSPLSGDPTFEQHCNLLMGSRALLDSLGTLGRALRKTAPNRNSLGLWEKPNNPDNIRICVEASFWPTSKAIPDEWAQRPQKVFEPKAHLLADFLAEVRKSRVKVYLVLPPQHALKFVHPTQDRCDRMAWEFDLLALLKICQSANREEALGPPIRFWTFFTFNPATTETLPTPTEPVAKLPSWLDLGHAKKEVGGLILGELFAPSTPHRGIAPAFGVDLLETDWNSFRSSWLKAHQAYCETHAEDVRWWRSLIVRSLRSNPSKGNATEEEPQPE